VLLRAEFVREPPPYRPRGLKRGTPTHDYATIAT
jgi:hypothetical protein